MEEKNELNDIILNKGGSAAGNKKIILAVATLGVVLIVVVMFMNVLTSKGTDNLPQPVLPPEPQSNQAQAVADEPLFEEVEVIQEDKQNNDSLDRIAQKLKEESQKEKTQAVVQIPKKEVVKPVTETIAEPAVTKTVKKEVSQPKAKHNNTYYIQVGSFSKYKPNESFLNSIHKQGYKYKYHKVTKNSKTLTKVLVGPFFNEKEARKALRTVKSSIEAGAFITKM